jgi:hypothetical protein
MKMKEKKTEEVVETSKISNELKEYLEFARQCRYQLQRYDDETCKSRIFFHTDDIILEEFGVDTSTPINIYIEFSDNNISEFFEEFVADWVNAYNKLDLTKFDNYTKLVIDSYTPPITVISKIRKHIKEKCAQHTTEE